MEYNKNFYQKTNDKKILHKVRKRWIVISSALLFAVSGGVLATHVNVSANTTNEDDSTPNQTKDIKINLSKVDVTRNRLNNLSTNNVTNQAQKLHQHIINHSINENPSINKSTISNIPSTSQVQSVEHYVNNLNIKFNNSKKQSTLNKPQQRGQITKQPVLKDTQDSNALNVGNIESKFKNSTMSSAISGYQPKNMSLNQKSVAPNINKKVNKNLLGANDPVIASGIWGKNQGGTTPWTFTQNGTLTLTGGRMATNIWPSYFTSDGDNEMHQVTSVITKPNPVTGSDVIAPQDCSDLFGSLGNNANRVASSFKLSNGVVYFDVGAIGRNELGDLRLVDVSHLNTSNTTNMLDMFASCDNSGNVPWPNNSDVDSGGTIQKIIGLGYLKTSKVFDMNGMFFGQNQLHSLDLSNFDTRNLLDGVFDIMMFPGAQVINMKLGPNTIFHSNAGGDGTDPWYNVTTGQYINNSGHQEQGLEDNNAHTGNWIDARSLATSGTWNQCPFYELTTNGINDLFVHSGPNGNLIDDNRPLNIDWNDIQHIYLNNVAFPNSVRSDFANCPSLQYITASDIDTSQTSDIDNLFANDNNLSNIGFTYDWNTDNIKHMSGTFRGLSIDNIDALQKWNTSNVRDMNSTFANDNNLIDGYGIHNWDTHSVNNMANMFANDNSLAVLPVGNNLVLYNAGDNGTPNIPGTWVNQNLAPKDVNNNPPVNNIYYNTEDDVKGTVTYRFGRKIIKSISEWLPSDTHVNELPSVPNYAVDPRNNNETWHITNENSNIDVQLDKYGKWGSANWYLTPDDIDTGHGKGNLYLDNGTLSNQSDGNNDGALNYVIPKSDRSHVDTLTTSNSVSLPENSTNLFRGGSNDNNFTNLRKIDLSKANTSPATNISGMFNYQNKMEILNMSNYNPSNVTNRNNIFANAFVTPNEKDTSLAELDLENTTTNQLFGTNQSTSGLAGEWVNDDNNPVYFFDGNSHPGIYFNTDKAVDATLNFVFSDTSHPVGSYTGWMPKMLFTAEIRPHVPTGYDLDPEDSQVYNLTDGETINIPVDEIGLWGKAEWLLGANDHLTIQNGDMENAQVPYTLRNASHANQTNVTSIRIDNATAPNDSSDLFAKNSDANQHGGFSNLKSFSAPSLYTDNVNNFSGMFAGQNQLTNLDLHNFYTPEGNNFSNMFYDDSDLNSLNLSNLDTFKGGSVNNDSGMFNGDSKLNQLTLGIQSLFDNNSNLRNAWLPNGDENDNDANNLTNQQSHPGTWSYVNNSGTWGNAAWIFNNHNLYLDNGNLLDNNSNNHGINWGQVNDIHTNKVIAPSNSANLFFNKPSLQQVDLSGLNTNNVNNASHMFCRDSNLTNLMLGDFNHLNQADAMFWSDGKLSNFTHGKFNASNASNLSSMFHGIGVSDLELSDLITNPNANLALMFSSDKNLKKLNISNLNSRNADTNHFWKNDNNLSTIKISNNTVTKNTNLPGHWFSKQGYLTNLSNDNNPVADTYYKSNGMSIYINQNNVPVGTHPIHLVNGNTIIWAKNSDIPYGYSLDKGQILKNKVTDVDISKPHYLYVTGNKADLNINYYDETNHKNLSDKDYQLNGTNAIGDEIKGIKIPKGYDVDESNLPAGYQLNHLNNNESLSYTFKSKNPDDIKSDNQVIINNEPQTIEHMKSDAIKLNAHNAVVKVDFRNSSDGKAVGNCVTQAKIGNSVNLSAKDNIEYGYAVNNRQQLSYNFNPVNIKSLVRQGNQIIDFMNPVTVYVHRVKKPSYLRIIFRNHNKRVGSDIIKGLIGEHINIKNFSDSNIDKNQTIRTPTGYQLNNSDLTNITMANRNSVIYDNVTGLKNIKNTINVIRIKENSDGTKSSTSKIPYEIVGTVNSDYSLNANDTNIKPSGYNVDNSHSTVANIIISNNNLPNPSTVIFYYRPTIQHSKPITVKFIEHNKILSNSFQLIGIVGNSVKPIDNKGVKDMVSKLGYTIDNNSYNNQNYTFSNQPQTAYLQLIGKPYNKSITIERFLNGSDGHFQKISDATVRLLNIRANSDVLITPYNLDTNDIKVGNVTISSDNSRHLNSLIPNQYHSIPGDNAIWVHITPKGNLDPTSSIKYIFNKNYQPDTKNNQIDTINIHYISSDSPYSGDTKTVNLGGTKYYEVDEESDQGIQSDSFNIEPYLNDIPTNVDTKNYDFLDNNVYDNSGNRVNVSKSGLKYNGKQADYYIKVTNKSNDNNLIIL